MLKKMTLALGLSIFCLHSAVAVPVTYLRNQAGFLAALGATPRQTQNFTGLAVGTNMQGVAFLPGVSVTTNSQPLQIFNSLGNNLLFSLGRGPGVTELLYDISIGSAFNAIGFDIAAYDPRTGPGSITVTFSDLTTLSIPVDPALPVGRVENDPIFFGIVSDLGITSIRWAEGLEIGGSCCEETALDNFIVANLDLAVPEPASLSLLSMGLIGIGYATRRKRAA